MKQRKFWFWLIILSLVGLVACGVLVGVGAWATTTMDTNGPAFGDAVAIVRVEGTILPGDAPPANPFANTGGAYSGEIIKNLKKANEDNSVKAVILYVDSPGGSSFASDEIALQVKKMNKPIITAMGSMAASGGYYVSAPTNEIWASPHSLTCSIGVISQFLNFEGFAKEYGITYITVKSGKFKDTGNPTRAFTKDEEALWQAMIDEIYGEFVKVVAEGRKMSEEEVRQVADGRVCTGQQAQKMKLVDKLGYLPDVIKRAAELGGIQGEPRLIEYKRATSFFEALSGAFYHPSPAEQLQQLLHYQAGSPLMYLYVGP